MVTSLLVWCDSEFPGFRLRKESLLLVYRIPHSFKSIWLSMRDAVLPLRLGLCQIPVPCHIVNLSARYRQVKPHTQTTTYQLLLLHQPFHWQITGRLNLSPYRYVFHVARSCCRIDRFYQLLGLNYTHFILVFPTRPL